MTLAECVKTARKAMGREWSQKRLIKELQKAGLKRTYSWLAGIEAGRKSKQVTTDVARILGKVLNRPPSYFLEARELPAPIYAAGSGHELKPLVDYLLAEVVDLKRRLAILESRASL